jgi:regulatory protein
MGSGSAVPIHPDPVSAADPATPAARRLIKLGVAALARREHTRFELQQKLRLRCQDPETPQDVVVALDYLQTKGYLSDHRAALSLVRVYGARWGRARLIQLFQARGLNPQTLAVLLPPAHSEFPRACQVLQKKYPQPPQTPQEWARQARFLAGRGFSASLVSRVLRQSAQGNLPDPDADDPPGFEG